MPQIKEITAPDTTLRPTETGVDAFAQAGRRAGAFYDQAANSLRQSALDTARSAEAVASAKEGEARSFAGVARSVEEAGKQADDFITHQEISHGAAAFAQLHSDLTDQWNNVAKTADPNDVSVAGQFRETQMEPALENFSGAFHTTRGQQWAEGHIAALRDHMFEKQSADMASRAADAVAVNVRQLSNSSSNTARNDPSAVDFLLKNADSSVAGIVGTSPNLKGAAAAKVQTETAQKIKEDIVRAGALGAIEKSSDPEKAAQAFADRYPQYVSGAELGQLAKTAKMQNRANALQERQLQILQRQQQEQAVKSDSNKSFANNVTFDPATNEPVISPNLIKDAIGLAKKYPDAPNSADHARTIINWAESQQKKEAKPVDDPATLRELTDRLYSPDNPTTRLDLMKANATGKLSNDRFQSMERLVTELEQGPLKEPIFKNAMEGAKGQIGMKVNGIDLNPGAYENFVHDFIPRYTAAKRAGMLEPDALDLKNPNSMISKAMAPYISPMKQQLQQGIAAGGGLNFTGNPAPAANSAAPVRVTSPAEAAKLAPGTRYIRPDGTVMTR